MIVGGSGCRRVVRVQREKGLNYWYRGAVES